MTDSGSFDSGDLIYAADINALNALVNSTCAAAGVTGSGVSSLASGDSITAAHINSIIGAYQRCWDAAVNSPGTRQSAVSAGNLVYGALFQNMWTQLNAMVFNRWQVWDESTEEDMATDSTFVCAMENATANGTETGSGGGLSGSDLVLTPYGTVDGLSGGYRRIDSAGSCIQPSTNFFNNFIKTSDKWCFIYKVKDTNIVSGYVGPCFIDALYNNYGLYLWGGGWYINQTNWGAGWSTSPNTSGVLYIVASYDGSGTLSVGWDTSKPANFAAIPTVQKGSFSITPGWSSYDFSFSNNSIFAFPGASNPTCYAAWTLFGKGITFDELP